MYTHEIDFAAGPAVPVRSPSPDVAPKVVLPEDIAVEESETSGTDDGSYVATSDDDFSWAEPPAPTDRRLRRLVIGLAIAVFGVSAFTVGAKVHESKTKSNATGFPAGFDPTALFGAGGLGGTASAGAATSSAGATPAADSGSSATVDDPTLGGLFVGEDDSTAANAETPAVTAAVTPDIAKAAATVEGIVTSITNDEIVVTKSDGSIVSVRIKPGTRIALPKAWSKSATADHVTIESSDTP